MALHSVVLTGFGAITSRGDLTSHSNAIAQGCNTYSIENFALERYLSSQKTYLDRCSALALGGCALALRDAGLALPDDNAPAFGITLGTHLGCIETMKVFWDKAVEKGMRLANPLLFSHSYFNSPISLCAIEFGLKGYHSTFCARNNSGLEAARAAYDALRLGHTEAMLCGGVEALTPTRALCEAGDVPLGEASVFFVLESEESARQRNATQIKPLDDAFFSISEARRTQVRQQFGDCGGAEGALCLIAPG